MIILISENTLKPQIEIEELHLDHRWGEDIYVLRAKINGEIVGKLNYGVYENEPNVKMLEVAPKWRRLGIATKLLKHLQQLYPDTEIELGYATKLGGKFLKSINRQFIPNLEHQKLSKRLSEIQVEIHRILKQMDNDDYTESAKLDDLYDEKYEVEDQLGEMKAGKWLISELSTHLNVSLTNSAVSKVFLGDKWVKKIKNTNKKTGERYSKEELLQYQIMADNQSLGIFPPTFVRMNKDRGGYLRPVIVQKKVDVDSQTSIYHNILKNIEPIQFRTLIESIALLGITNSVKEELEEIHDILNPQLSKYFSRYVEISEKLHLIRKKYHFEFSVDLHSGNYGIYNGDIVVIDFSSPFLKV